MDLSNLDCPQYVKFPIEDFETSCSLEDSLNIEKHLEDSHTDSNIASTEEESYIFIEDSSHTETSISESEECSDKRSQANSEQFKDDKTRSDVSDQFISAMGSFLEDNSCAEDNIVHVKSEAHSEHESNEEVVNDAFLPSDNMSNVCSDSNLGLEAVLAVPIKSEVYSESVEHEKVQSDVCDRLSSMLDMYCESSCLGDILAVDVKSEVYSQYVKDENTESKVSDHISELVSKENSCAEDVISVCFKSEAASEGASGEKIESVVGDQIDTRHDVYSGSSSSVEDDIAIDIKSAFLPEYVRDEKVQSDVSNHCDSMIDSPSKPNSCARDNLSVCSKSESYSDYVKDKNMQNDVNHLDNVIDLVLNAVSCARPEDNVEHIENRQIESDHSDEIDILDGYSETNPCIRDALAVHSKPEDNAEHIENRKIESDHSDEIDILDGYSETDPCIGDALAVHSKSEVHSEQVKHEHVLSDVYDQLHCMVDTVFKTSSCANDEILVCVKSETNSESESEDLNGLSMATNSEEVEVVEADINIKNLESMEKNESNSQRNEVCEITKVSSVSKAVVLKNKQDTYVPLAQQVAAFQQKCPERYLSVHGKNFKPSKHWAPPKYVPKSPKLQSAKRHREIKNNVEDIKRYEFHARPLNPKIFEKPISLEIEKQSTQPKSFTLKTAERAEAHAKNENLDVKKNEFHARPIPKSCHVKKYEPEKVKIQATKPKSPNFALKNREEKWSQRSNKTNEDTKPTISKTCRKQPKQIDLSQSVLKHEKKPIEVLPFSFEEREKAKLALKQQKSQDLGKENLKPGFKAREMPSFKLPALPSIQRKPTTQPEPFIFLSEARIASQTKCDTTISDKTDMKAHPDNVLKTLNPKKALSLAEMKKFQLHTEKRAAEWRQLEEIKKAEEMQKQQAAEAYKAAKEREEQLEIMKMRQNAVHKANPIRTYKNVEIKPCNLVTQPFTPKFETDKRLQSRLDKTEINF